MAESTGSSGQPAPSAQVPAALAAQDDSGRNAAWPQGSASAPVAPSAPQTSAPTPAVQPAGSFSQAPETVQPRQAAALTAQVDLSNPAAVQRLWHSVTASLRKVNPARGVLFMNAKVSAEADGRV